MTDSDNRLGTLRGRAFERFHRCLGAVFDRVEAKRHPPDLLRPAAQYFRADAFVMKRLPLGYGLHPAKISTRRRGR